MRNILDRLRNRIFYPWLAWLRSARHRDDVLATVDLKEFYELRQYKFQTQNYHYQKYFNISYWLRHNVVRALSLNLHNKTDRPLNILDIGSGFGYFPYVARFYNHKVVGVDLPGDTLFDKVTDFLELDIRHHTIESHEKLPVFPEGKFDLITSFQLCFNGHKSDNLWGVEEWRFFLDDLFANHIKPEGRIYFEFNYDPQIKGWISDDVRSLFLDSYNAVFHGPSRVTLINDAQ